MHGNCTSWSRRLETTPGWAFACMPVVPVIGENATEKSLVRFGDGPGPDAAVRYREIIADAMKENINSI